MYCTITDREQHIINCFSKLNKKSSFSKSLVNSALIRKAKEIVKIIQKKTT